MKSSSLPRPDEQSLLYSLFGAATAQGHPVAFWRMPGQTARHALISLSPVRQVQADVEALEPGFLLSPFDPAQEEKYFLPADLHYCTDRGDEPTESFATQQFGTPQYMARKAFGEALDRRAVGERACAPRRPAAADRQAFEQMVAKAVEALQAGAADGTFQKVVLSRAQAVPLPEDFDPVHSFERLCRLYPSAFVSLWSVPELGTWMTASPETLIRMDNNTGMFYTVALAGTQPRQDLEDLSEALWRQKEIEEQAMVSRYIINCFKRIRLREFEEDGPKTIAAGHLLHLLTEFAVDTQATGFPQLGTVMLRLLHPTSAVCGMPREEALRFLARNEGYERSFYSGYLGPVHIEGVTQLFVQLRCLQLFEREAFLYAGAGITRHSSPAKEWQETALKMAVIARGLSDQPLREEA